MREDGRIIKVMVDNTVARYIRLTDFASSEAPPSEGVFDVDKLDGDGHAHIGSINFKNDMVGVDDFKEVVKCAIRELAIDRLSNVPSWLTEDWIRCVHVNFSNTEVYIQLG